MRAEPLAEYVMDIDHVRIMEWTSFAAERSS